MLGRFIDVFTVAKARRAELDEDFLEAQRILCTSNFRSDKYRRFSEAYIAKLMVVNHDPEFVNYFDKLAKNNDAFLRVDNGSYYSTYLRYLKAVVDNDSEIVEKMHRELAKVRLKGLARSCLPTFPAGSKR